MEILWAAAIGTLGAVVASAVTGLVTYKITARQVDTERYRVESDVGDRRSRLAYDSDESRKTRLVASRVVWAVPLRDALSSWLAIGESLFGSLAWSERVYGNPDSADKQIAEAAITASIVEVFQQQSVELRKISLLKYQVTDKLLLDLINELNEKWGPHALNMKDELGEMLSSMEDISDPEEMFSAIRKMRSAMSEFNELVLKANKRLEQLLAGDSST